MHRFFKIRPALLASLVILSGVIVAFFPAFFEGKILAPSDITKTLLAPWDEASNGSKPHNHNTIDAVTQYLPYRVFAEKSLREDGYIGWNPYEMGGYSLAGNTMALPGSWAMQLHRFLGFKDAWNLGIAAEFLIAGFGMLVFLRSRMLPWLACLVGAVAYMANSQFIIWIYHRWALGSFCWMPWVLWSIADGFHWRTLTARQLLLPFFIAMAMLGGSLQHLAFVVLVCLCVFAGGISSRSIRKETPAILGWTMAFILAFAMSAFTLIPQISAYFANTSIGHIRGGIGYENGLTQPLYQSLLIPAQIWPWLMGDPQTLDGSRLFKCGLMDLAYLGTIPMVLALMGIFHKGMPRQAKWLILAGLLIPLTPLVGPLYHRVQLLFLLGGSWMAAEMIARMPLATSGYLIRGLKISVGALGLALLIGTCLPHSLRTSIENQVIAKALAAGASSSISNDKAWIENRAVGWTNRFSLANPLTAWTYGLLALGTAGLVISTRKQPSRAKWGSILILSATAFELLTFSQTWTTFSDPEELRPPHPTIDAVRLLAGPHRVLQRSPEVGFADTLATPNLLSSYGIASVDSYESIQYRSSSVALVGEAPETRLALAGVGISVRPVGTIAAKGTEAWPLEETVGGFEIHKNTLVPGPVIAGTGPPPVMPGEILNATKTAVPILPDLKTMNRWSLQAPEEATWIRIAQNWHEGWRWKISGQDWKPFHKGSDAACWINSLPAGSRHIEVRFFPRPAWLSLFSLVTAVLLLGILMFVCRAQKNLLVGD